MSSAGRPRPCPEARPARIPGPVPLALCPKCRYSWTADQRCTCRGVGGEDDARGFACDPPSERRTPNGSPPFPPRRVYTAEIHHPTEAAMKKFALLSLV